jgi:hypothetical protein
MLVGVRGQAVGQKSKRGQMVASTERKRVQIRNDKDNSGAGQLEG